MSENLYKKEIIALSTIYCFHWRGTQVGRKLNWGKTTNPIANSRIFDSDVDSWSWAVAANWRSKTDDTNLNANAILNSSNCSSWVTIATIPTLFNQCAEHSVSDAIPEARAGSIGNYVFRNFHKMSWQCSRIDSSPSSEVDHGAWWANSATSCCTWFWESDRTNMWPTSEWRTRLLKRANFVTRPWAEKKCLTGVRKTATSKSSVTRLYCGWLVYWSTKKICPVWRLVLPPTRWI